MNLLRTRPRAESQAPPADATEQLDIEALAAAIDAAAVSGPGDRPPVMLVSRRPPLLLLALPQDAETLPGILTSRAFSVPLGDRTASCHLHATADGGQNALLVGNVVAYS